MASGRRLSAALCSSAESDSNGNAGAATSSAEVRGPARTRLVAVDRTTEQTDIKVPPARSAISRAVKTFPAVVVVSAPSWKKAIGTQFARSRLGPSVNAPGCEAGEEHRGPRGDYRKHDLDKAPEFGHGRFAARVPGLVAPSTSIDERRKGMKGRKDGAVAMA